MHTITLHNNDFSTNYTQLFQGADYSNLQYDLQLMKAGGMQFQIELRNPKATPTNLKLFNRVSLKKNGSTVFLGYIENLTMNTNIITVSCVGILGFFKKRLYSADIISEDAATAFETILTTINGVDDTGISFGTSDIVETITDIKLNRSNVLSAFDKIANLVGGEYIVNTDRTLDFVTQVGSDKSASIVLRYRVNQINTSTLESFNLDVEGKDMANTVIGIGSGNITSVQQSAASIAEFGVIEDTLNLLQTEDTGDLDSETENYVASHKDAFYGPKVTLNTSKINPDDIDIGDIVKVDLNNGFIVVNDNYRVLRKVVRVSENKTEVVNLDVMPEDIKTLPQTLIDDIVSIEDRVSLIESEL